MSGDCNTSANRTAGSRPRATARLAGVALALLMAGPTAAQDAPAEPPPSAAPPAGILDTIGRWLDESKAKIDGQIKNSQDAAKDAAERAGQATGVVLGWPGAKVAHGRVRCAVAPNGAPDCTEAANALCRTKGFSFGKSLDINTAQKCPTWVWLSGRPAPEGTCTTETFVLGASCQ